MGAHAFLTTLFLVTGQWIALIVNVPLVSYNVNKYVPAAQPAYPKSRDQEVLA